MCDYSLLIGGTDFLSVLLKPHLDAHLWRRTGINDTGYSVLLFICQVKALGVKPNQGSKMSKFMTVYDLSGICLILLGKY